MPDQSALTNKLLCLCQETETARNLRLMFWVTRVMDDKSHPMWNMIGCLEKTNSKTARQYFRDFRLGVVRALSLGGCILPLMVFPYLEQVKKTTELRNNITRTQAIIKQLLQPF